MSQNMTGEFGYEVGLTGSVLVQAFCGASSLAMVLGNTAVVE